jgi:hypothetical protein
LGARIEACDFDLSLASKSGFLKGEPEVISQIAPTSRATLTGGAKAKAAQPAKDLLKDLKGIPEAKVKAESTRLYPTKAVVGCLFLWIREYLISFVDLFKAGLGICFIRDVGVELASQPPIR